MKRTAHLLTDCLKVAPLALSLALCLCSPPLGLADHLTVVPSDEANKQAYVTNKDIRWYRSLEEAQAEARKEGKLVFWLHMLGTMDGAT